MKASVCAFVIVFLGRLCSSNAQFQQQLANILSGLGNIALDGLSSNLGGAAAYDTCIPYDLPAQFESYQDFCRYLSQLPDDDINTMLSCI